MSATAILTGMLNPAAARELRFVIDTVPFARYSAQEVRDAYFEREDSVGGMELAAMVSLAILLSNITLKAILGIIRMIIRATKKSRKEKNHDSLKKAI